MSRKSDIGIRMKEFYECRSQTYLIRRVPVVARLDGRAFHSFTKRFEKPYDYHLNEMLSLATLEMCKKVQGCKFALRQSDEMSILLMDTDNLKTEGFFDYKVQKMCSILAATLSVEFNNLLLQRGYLQKIKNLPVFDCRVFNIPECEVTNYFWWRTLDAIRNSIQSVAQSKFSHKQLLNKSNNQMQEMLFMQHQVNWSKLPQEQKAGTICYKMTDKVTICSTNTGNKSTKRKKWISKPNPGTLSELSELIEV